MQDSEGTTLQRVRVLLPMPVGDGYDYAVTGEPPMPGTFVDVPLGPRVLTGVVWPDAPDLSVPESKLKHVAAIHEGPRLSADTLAFVDWVARYCLSPRGTVLRLVMRSGQQLNAPAPKTGFIRAPMPPTGVRMTPQREAVLAAADPATAMTAADLAKAAGVSDGVVRSLADAGDLNPSTFPPTRLSWRPTRNGPDGVCPRINLQRPTT